MPVPDEVVVFNAENLYLLVARSATLSALCSHQEISHPPFVYATLSSWLYMGVVWQAVQQGKTIIVAAFKGQQATALGTLHKEAGLWQAGFFADSHEQQGTTESHMDAVLLKHAEILHSLPRVT